MTEARERLGTPVAVHSTGPQGKVMEASWGDLVSAEAGWGRALSGGLRMKERLCIPTMPLQQAESRGNLPR